MRMAVASSLSSTAFRQSCTACSISRVTGCWSVNLPGMVWDSFRHPTRLPSGSEGRDGNGKRTCRHGFLRRGISSSRGNSVFHIRPPLWLKQAAVMAVPASRRLFADEMKLTGDDMSACKQTHCSTRACTAVGGTELAFGIPGGRDVPRVRESSRRKISRSYPG